MSRVLCPPDHHPDKQVPQLDIFYRNKTFCVSHAENETPASGSIGLPSIDTRNQDNLLCAPISYFLNLSSVGLTKFVTHRAPVQSIKQTIR